MSDFHGLDRRAARLSAQFRRLAWRMSRMERPGVVEEYDAARHMARVRLTVPGGDGGLAGWCRIEELAGEGRSKATLKVGQTVTLKCPNGDIRQGYIAYGGIFSDTNRIDSDEADEIASELGDGSMQMVPDHIEVKHGGRGVKIADGKVYLAG